MTSQINLTREEQQSIKDLLNACKKFRNKMIEVGFHPNPVDNNLDYISKHVIVNPDTIDPYLRECVMNASNNLFSALETANQLFLVGELLNKLTPELERRYRVDYTFKVERNSYVTVHANSEEEALQAFESSVINRSGEAWDEIVEDGDDDHEEYESSSCRLLTND